MEYDREALIAYTYDLYCVELSIDQTKEAIDILKKNCNEIQDYKEKSVSRINENSNKAINIVKASFIEETYSKEVRFWEHKKAIILATAFILIYVLGSLCLYSLFNISRFRYADFGGIKALWILLGIGLIIAAIVIYNREEEMILEKRKQKAANKDEKMRANIKKKVIKIEDKQSANINDSTIDANNFSDNINSLLYKQEKQLEKLEEYRMELYESQLLIPFMHQNLRSIAYIYQYLITTQNIDLNYIFTQVNFRILQDKLDEIIKNQNTMIIIQCKMLSELEKHTDILTRIDNHLVDINQTIKDFRGSVIEKLNSIHEDINNFNADQQLILNNQAILYNQFLENAKAKSKTDAETNAYLRMIAHHTELSSFFQRAEFLGIDYDRSWYDVALLK